MFGVVEFVLYVLCVGLMIVLLICVVRLFGFCSCAHWKVCDCCLMIWLFSRFVVVCLLSFYLMCC